MYYKHFIIFKSLEAVFLKLAYKSSQGDASRQDTTLQTKDVCRKIVMLKFMYTYVHVLQVQQPVQQPKIERKWRLLNCMVFSFCAQNLKSLELYDIGLIFA